MALAAPPPRAIRGTALLTALLTPRRVRASPAPAPAPRRWCARAAGEPDGSKRVSPPRPSTPPVSGGYSLSRGDIVDREATNVRFVRKDALEQERALEADAGESNFIKAMRAAPGGLWVSSTVGVALIATTLLLCFEIFAVASGNISIRAISGSVALFTFYQAVQVLPEMADALLRGDGSS